MSKWTDALYALHKAGRSEFAVPKKWQLLPATHPTVRRRLVRALNDAGWKSLRSFYHDGGKWNCARIRKGQLQIGMCQEDWHTVDCCSHFDDGNGNAIMVSRSVCGR